MAKSKFFRVATEGATADGRKIERKDLIDIAETYNRVTYAARVNCEHLRGLSIDGPFGAFGDVLTFKTDDITLQVGGKNEKRLALYAQIEPTEELIAANKKKQKQYTSIEIQPDFGKSGRSYCVGLAVTDSPASLGTEILEFASKAATNPFADRKQSPGNLIVAAEEFTLELEAEQPASDVQSEVTGMFAAIKTAFSNFGKAPEPAPQPAPVALASGTTDLSALTTVISDAFAKLETSFTATAKTQADTASKFSSRLDALEAKLNETPEKGFKARPTASGGDGRVRAEC